MVRYPPYQGGIKGGSPRLSAPPLLRGAGGDRVSSYESIIFELSSLTVTFSLD